jgi:hypothetical protein
MRPYTATVDRQQDLAVLPLLRAALGRARPAEG